MITSVDFDKKVGYLKSQVSTKSTPLPKQHMKLKYHFLHGIPLKRILWN